jgi:uncharacterized lipoprotein YmbA
MNGYPLRFALVWLVSVGAGCTSAPVHYYTLAPPADRTLPASQTTFALDVRVVHTPPQLNRSELMVRTGPAEVTLLENERWASPMNDEIKEAVRLELQRRLGRMTGWRPDFTKLTLDIDVHRFEAELGRYALFEASWRATLSSTGQRSAGARVTSCTFRADEKIEPGYAGMVEGYQRQLAAFAEGIAAALTSQASGIGRASGIDALCQKSVEGSAGVSSSKDQGSPTRG